MISMITLAVAASVDAVPIPAAIATALLIPAAVVDVEQRRLPDVWVASAFTALIVALAIESAIVQTLDVGHEVGGLAGGAVALALPLLILHVVSPASMGFGDVKAAAVLGAAVGTIDWRLGAVALCVAALVGAASGMATRRRTIAFGPSLVFGAWLVLIAHEPIITNTFSGGLEP